MFPLQLDVADFTRGRLNPLLPSRMAIAMCSWAPNARPPNSMLRLLDFRNLCAVRAVMTLERSLAKLEIPGQRASTLGENVLCKTSCWWVVSLNQVQRCKWCARRHWHCLAHCKRWIECPEIPNFSVSVWPVLGTLANSVPKLQVPGVFLTWPNQQNHSLSCTLAPMIQRQSVKYFAIVVACGNGDVASLSRHVTSLRPPNTVPFSFRELVCFTAVKPSHQPSQTRSLFPWVHSSKAFSRRLKIWFQSLSLWLFQNLYGIRFWYQNKWGFRCSRGYFYEKEAVDSIEACRIIQGRLPSEPHG